MAAVGALKHQSSLFYSSSSSSSNGSNVGKSAIPEKLSFAASNFFDKKIVGVSKTKEGICNRNTMIVPPKAVSDSKDKQSCLDPDASRSVLGIILGGGAGSRLYPLTKKREKPAVPFGGNYRLVDVALSNCLNSNINNIYVLTQYNSTSPNRHLLRAYTNNMGGYKHEGLVEVLAAQQSPENPNWFQVMKLQEKEDFASRNFDAKKQNIVAK